MQTEPNVPGATSVGVRNSRVAWVLAGVLGGASIGAGAHLMSRNAATESPDLTAAAPAAAAARTAVPPAAAKPTHATPVTKIARADTATPAAAPVCSSCGVVESVRTVTHKGEAHGVGAVAGGVVGAVVGNQMGKGDGRKAMTVLGALGGGLAGNEIEKRSKTTTAHEVKVRMDDGSLRTVEQAQAPRVGERVKLEGQTLRHLDGAAPARG